MTLGVLQIPAANHLLSMTEILFGQSESSFVSLDVRTAFRLPNGNSSLFGSRADEAVSCFRMQTAILTFFVSPLEGTLTLGVSCSAVKARARIKDASCARHNAMDSDYGCEALRKT